MIQEKTAVEATDQDRARSSPAPAPAVREILFPTDFSSASSAAFEHARFWAERFGARLTLYHAVDVPSALPALEAVIVSDGAADSARWQLELRAEGLPFPHQVVVEHADSAARSLVSWIDATRPDLTIMGSHGRGTLAHLFLGSVTERVLRGTRHPLLCVRVPDHGLCLPYRRILVPTDLSEASRRAFPLAALLARTFGAEVVVLHVTPRLPSGLNRGLTPPSASTIPSGDDVHRFLRSDFEAVPLRVHVLTGTPWDQIIDTARDERTDAIIMSTHGQDSVSDLVLGSHTQRVMHHASCPVLVV
jgi:nucleotide-binding universal stress UspA family protein